MINFPQVGNVAGGSGQRDNRRGGPQKAGQQRVRPTSRTRQRLPSGGTISNAVPTQTQPSAAPLQHQQQQQQQQQQQMQLQQNHHRQPGEFF